MISYDRDKKNLKINEVLKDIMKSQNYDSVTIFENSKVFFELDLDIQNFLNSPSCRLLNGDIINEDQIVDYLISNFESITEDATQVFSPHIKTHHIIFLDEFLNYENKLEIKKLQKRSNIAVYYFEENNN